MRWRKPRSGDTRLKSGFLFFPLKLLDREGKNYETRWLESTWWKEDYVIDPYEIDGYWRPIAWVSSD